MSYTSTPAIERGRPLNIDNVGTIGSTTTAGLSVKEYGMGVIRQTVIRLDGVSVTMTDAGAAGSNGTVPLYVFPRGDITILGGTANFSSKATSTGSVDSIEPFTNTPGITASGSGSIATGAVVNWSVGSVAGSGALTTTEADIIASVATTLVAYTKTAVGRVIKLGTTIFPDATTTAGAAQTARLNFYVADADSSANDTLTVTGEIIITWLCSGDA